MSGTHRSVAPAPTAFQLGENLREIHIPSYSMPLQLTSFIGRSAEIQAVCELLLQPELRLLTLTGAGGIGKTRLALEVATRLSDAFPQGAAFVPLETTRDARLVGAATAEALGIQDIPGQPLISRLQRFLAPRQMLLVFDNFEHLLDAVSLVPDLLVSCPSLKVLCTSRVPLHITGEHVHTVPSLTLASAADPQSDEFAIYGEAAQLFIDRARAASSDFGCTPQNIRDVSDICLLLDGIPLAIELAAARVSVLPIHALKTRLTPGLNLLIDGPRDSPDRQRTMRNSLSWSHDLLNPVEQRLYSRLGAFPGSCSLECIETISVATGESSGDAFEALAALVQHNLLRQVDAGTANLRYVMLETVREDAFGRLTARGEIHALRRCQAAFLVTLSESRQSGIPEQEWLEQVEPEHENIRAVLRWAIEQGEVDVAQRLVAALWLHFWAIRGHFREGREWAEQSRALGEGSAPAVLEEVLFAESEFASCCGDSDHAIVLAQEALATAQVSGSTGRVGMALHHLAMAVSHRDGMASAEPIVEQAYRLLTGAKEFRELRTAAATTHNLAVAVSWRGDLERAETLALEALRNWEQLASAWGTVGTLTTLASIALDGGDAVRSRSLGKQALALAWKTGSKVLIADALRMAAGMTPTSEIHGELLARVWSAADALIEDLGLQMSQEDRAYVADSLATIRTALRPEAFETHWAIGQGQPLETIVDEILAFMPSTPAGDGDIEESKAKRVNPDGLTSREMEILHRLAEHKTDQEIADELSISRRTVNAHVAHVLAKLGVPTRRAAVHQARELNMLPSVERTSSYT